MGMVSILPEPTLKDKRNYVFNVALALILAGLAGVFLGIYMGKLISPLLPENAVLLHLLF
jgi:uncharacterized membrane protein YfcA